MSSKKRKRLDAYIVGHHLVWGVERSSSEVFIHLVGKKIETRIQTRVARDHRQLVQDTFFNPRWFGEKEHPAE